MKFGVAGISTIAFIGCFDAGELSILCLAP
jgi:hypothetical protein